MNNKKSIKKNYIYNMLYQLLVIIIPVITTPYLARKLGADGNGIYGYTISIVTYFILFGSLGINLYGQREIAYNQSDKEKRSKIFWELIIIKSISMLISAVIFYFVFCRSGDYSIYYKILLLEMLANIIDISWLYQGMEDFKKTVIRNFIVKIITVACIFIFIKSPSDVGNYLYIYVFSTLLGGLSLWLGIKKYIGKSRELEFKKHIPKVLKLFVPQIAIQVYTVLDKTMIGAILNDMSEVGYYEQAQKIIKIMLTMITAIGTVMMPRIAHCYASGKTEQLTIYMKKSFSFVFMLSFPLMFGIIATSNNFVPLFFGDGYDKVPLLMSILSAIIIFISISTIIGTQFLLSVKREKEFTTSVVVGAIINFILNLLLIGKYKSIGAAIATIIAEFFVTFVQCYFIRKDFDLKSIFFLSIKYILASLVMFGLCMLVDYLIVDNFTGIIIQVIVGIISYFGLLLLFKDHFFLEIIKVVFKRNK